MKSVVRSVVNLIEQTQGTDLPSVPQTTKFTLSQLLRTANNTIQKFKCNSTDDIYTEAQYSRFGKTYALK